MAGVECLRMAGEFGKTPPEWEGVALLLMDWLLELKSLGFVALAMVLGAVIGSERELADKPAGMRTHMLVSGAAALLVLLGNSLVEGFGDNLRSEWIRADPIRVIEAIVTGVAFLGAGTIIRRGPNHDFVQGLTTAASLLFTAAVGIGVATKEIVLAVGATLLALATLRSAFVIEKRIKSKGTKSQASRGEPEKD